MIDLNAQLSLIILFSYMLGSISPSLIIGKVFFHKDIREEGSKNLGGSNAGRILGKKIGILVILLDFLKGFFAVWITSSISHQQAVLMTLSGLFVILGHIFPVFAKFRGGKGVATTGGVLLFLKPTLIPVGLMIIFIFWMITKYESLSTLVAFTFLLVYLMLAYKLIIIQIIASIVYLGILFAHRLNIIAIIKKTEKKKSLFSKFE